MNAGTVVAAMVTWGARVTPRILALVLSACSGSDDARRARTPVPEGTDGATASALRPRQQDSAGVTLLVHAPEAFQRAPQWSLEPTASVTLGGSGGKPEYDLTYAWNVALLADGTIITLAPIGNRLLVFSPDGRPARSLGRQGQGPGELMAPGGMARLRGDTVVVPDVSNHRINWVVPTKGIVASVPIPPGVGFGRVAPVGALRSGAMVLANTGTPRGGATDRVTRSPAPVYVISPTGDSGTTVATLPGLEVVRVPTRYRGRPEATQVIRFSRSAVAIAWDSMIATGSGEGYTIDLRDDKGALRSSIRVPLPRRVVTDAMRDSAIARDLKAFNGPGTEGMVNPRESRRLVEVTPVADSLPPYGPWFVSPDNTLWVIDGSEPGPRPGAATAFAPDGSILGRLTWSRAAMPVAFGTDRVVMRELDDDNFVSLGVYRMQRPR